MPAVILATIPFLKGLPWRVIGLGLLAAGLVIGGWTARGWKADRDISAINERNATAATKASEKAREREQVLADAIAMIDAEHTAERTKADAENVALRADVAAGAVRLHVRAACPAAGLPQAAAGAGVDLGTGAELNPDARPDYLALREGLSRLETKLTACQDTLTRERMVAP